MACVFRASGRRSVLAFELAFDYTSPGRRSARADHPRFDEPDDERAPQRRNQATEADRVGQKPGGQQERSGHEQKDAGWRTSAAARNSIPPIGDAASGIRMAEPTALSFSNENSCL